MNPRLGDRSAFPQLEARAYLNHAAISPVSVQVSDAVTRVLGDYARRGVGAVFDWVEQRGRLKEKLATLLGAGAGANLALTASTTRSLTDLALCIPWQRGDRVALLRGEFPANVTPWQRAAELFGLQLVWLDADAFRTEPDAAWQALSAELERGLRLLSVSAVQFQTGHRMPLPRLARLCHEHGAELCVDAIQAAGVVPLNVTELQIDYLACGSQKWLMGMEGVGFVYVAPSRVSALRPIVAGWLSHEDPLQFLFQGAGHLRYDRPLRQSVDFLEGSAANVLGAAALDASVSVLLELGVEAVYDHVQAYLDRLERGMIDLGFHSRRCERTEERSSILSFDPPAGVDVVNLQQALGKAGVSCSLPDGLLRFSPHYPNAFDEVPFVLRAVESCL